jgi:hypothetical protein
MARHSQEIDQNPASVKAAQALFFIIGAIWLAFGAATLVKMGSSTNPTITLWIVVLLMFGNAGVLLLLSWGIGRQKKLFFYLGIIVLAANIFLTVTDEFGIFDLITLIIDLVLLILLFVTRSRYLTANEE